MPLPQPLIAYTIHKRERDGRKFWTRIGDAQTNRDGSIAIELRALPVNGVIVLRGARSTETATPPVRVGQETRPEDFVGTLAHAYLEAPDGSSAEDTLERLLVETAERYGIDYEHVLQSLGPVQALDEDAQAFGEEQER